MLLFFCFLSFYFRAIFKFLSKSNSNDFWIFKSKPLYQINQMHQHVCTSMLLNLMMSFNLMKKFIFLYFHEHKIPNEIILALFPKIQILGCYNSTPLRWISSSRFGRRRLGDRNTPSLNSSLLSRVIPSSG